MAPVDLLATLGAWPVGANETRRAYAQEVVAALRQQLLSVNMSFAPPCAAAHSQLLSHDWYFFQQTACTNGYNFTFPWAATQVID